MTHASICRLLETLLPSMCHLYLYGTFGNFIDIDVRHVNLSSRLSNLRSIRVISFSYKENNVTYVAEVSTFSQDFHKPLRILEFEAALRLWEGRWETVCESWRNEKSKRRRYEPPKLAHL